jgi:hypothetical protein
MENPTPVEFAKQLRRFANWVAYQSSDWLNNYAVDMDPVTVIHDLWDHMLNSADFGTEGQRDPRGDRRG